MSTELALDVFIAEHAFLLGKVFAVGSKDAAVERDRREEGWGNLFEA